MTLVSAIAEHSLQHNYR